MREFERDVKATFLDSKKQSEDFQNEIAVVREQEEADTQR